MARKPNVECNRCGKPAYCPPTKHGTAYRCQPCRRIEPQPTKREASSLAPSDCAQCGCRFKRRSASQQYCSIECRASARRQHESRVCVICATPFVWRNKSGSAGKCCGQECGYELLRRERAAQRKPRPEPKPKSLRVSFGQCKYCATWMSTQGTTPRKVCAPCRQRVWNERQEIRDRVAHRKATGPLPPRINSCDWCGQQFPTRSTKSRWCSERCAKTARGSRSDRQRAAYHGVECEWISRRKVYDRDGWTCGICGDAIDRAAKWPDLMCASLDHVVPMADGGPHLYSNVQAAHFLCNSYKSARELDLRIA